MERTPKPVVGRYQFLRRLPSTGKNVVWLAQDEATGRAVVASLLPIQRVEGLLPLVGMSHPHMAQVVDVVSDWNVEEIPGGDPPHSDGAIVLALHITGRTLHQRLQAGRIDPIRAAQWTERLADLLATIHRMGGYHGALSPRAVLVARTTHGVAPVLTHLVVPPAGAYCSPQRVTGGGPSAADDVWALCATLYTALAGAPPFSGSSRKELARAILAGDPPGLADVETGLVEVARGGLRAEAGLRWRAAAAPDAALKAWLHERNIETREDIRTVFPSDVPVRTTPPLSADDLAIQEAHRSPDSPEAEMPVSVAPRPTEPSLSELARAVGVDESAADGDPSPPPTETTSPPEGTNDDASSSTPPALPPAGDHRAEGPSSSRAAEAETPSSDERVPVSKPTSEPDTSTSIEAEPEAHEPPKADASDTGSSKESEEAGTSGEAPAEAATDGEAPGQAATDGEASEEADAEGDAHATEAQEAPEPSEPSSPTRPEAAASPSPPKPAPLADEPEESAPRRLSAYEIAMTRPPPTPPPSKPPPPEPQDGGRATLVIVGLVALGLIAMMVALQPDEAPLIEADPEVATQAAPETPPASPPPAPAASKPRPMPAVEPSGRIVPAPSSRPRAPAAEPRRPAPAPTDPTACFVGIMPTDTFGKDPSLDYVCEQNEMWGLTRKLTARVAKRGKGEGMEMWVHLTRYELPAIAMLRERCCPNAEPFTADTPKTACNPLAEVLRSVAKSPTDENIARFEETFDCLVKRKVRYSPTWDRIPVSMARKHFDEFRKLFR